jgi:hypothetical protein
MTAELKSISEALQPRSLAPTARVPELITIEELAELWKISAKKLRRACQSARKDPLPAIRIGASIRFDRTDPRLLEWLDRRTQKGSTL